MNLPSRLQEAIEKDIAGTPLNEIQKGFNELAERYRDPNRRKSILGKERFIFSLAQRKAYLAYRFPATFAVARHVLHELDYFFTPETLLDLGAGPGTLTLAAASVFPSLQRSILMEEDGEWQRSTIHLQATAEVKMEVQIEDFTSAGFPSVDLIGGSYCLSELSLEKQQNVVKKGWENAKKGVVFIEPGTPYGFAAILNARATLIALGASIAAPCPHHNQCPLAALNTWCHFSQRLERSKIHRYLKDGDLGYEDEKYSYLIASKVPFEHYTARLVYPSEKHGGHIRLALCTAEGLQRPTFSKKDGELYKKLRKLDWGDRFP